MKKLILGLFILFLTTNCYATTASRYNTYGTTDQVTSANLNGNLDNILNVVNGNLDNTNAKTSSGIRFYEVVSALPAAGTEGRLVYLTTDDLLYKDNGSAFSAISETISTLVGTFERDTATATGTQAITGVGFQPTVVIFFAETGSAGEASWGFDEGSPSHGISDDYNITANTYSSGSTASIVMAESSGNTYAGGISTMDSDGFTVTWTRTGTPTGTATIKYLAIK